MTRSRRFGASLLLLASALTVALVAAELFLQATRPIYTTGIRDAYEYDSILGVRLKSSLDLSRVTDHREEVHSNAIGTANYQDDFRGYRDLVFALGDSYTQGVGAPADESYPLHLDLLLNQDTSGNYKRSYGVVNLGLAAFGAEQSLQVLQRYSHRLGRPRACLYLGSDNDFDDDLLFKSGSRHAHLVSGSPRWGTATPFLIWLANRQIVIRAKLLIANRKLIHLRRASSTIHPSVNPSASSAAPTIAELEWPVIRRIVDDCASTNAVIVLAWSKPPGTSGSYEWLKAKSKSEGIAFNDWYSRVESVRASIPRLPIPNNHSGGHYRGWVNGQIAAGFREALAPLLPP